LALTPLGEQRIGQLSELHLAELVRLRPALEHLLEHEVISGTAP
jgi:hypothetical protein